MGQPYGTVKGGMLAKAIKMPKGDKCFFPGCPNIIQEPHGQKACPDHKQILHRWNTHRSTAKKKRQIPLSFEDYYARYIRGRRRINAMTREHATSEGIGPDVVYDGGPVSPCARCRHTWREKHHRGCVECLERVAYAEAVAGAPVRAGWGEMVAFGR